MGFSKSLHVLLSGKYACNKFQLLPSVTTSEYYNSSNNFTATSFSLHLIFLISLISLQIGPCMRTKENENLHFFNSMCSSGCVLRFFSKLINRDFLNLVNLLDEIVKHLFEIRGEIQLKPLLEEPLLWFSLILPFQCNLGDSKFKSLITN